MYRPKTVCHRLAVPATTLRVWSNEFAGFLSPSAQSATTERGGPAQRRYTDGDLAVLARVKTLLEQDLTYEEVREALVQTPATSPVKPSAQPATDALARSQQTANGHEIQLASALSVLEELPQQFLQIAEVLTRQDQRLEELLEHNRQLNQQLSVVLARLPEPDHRRWWQRLLG
jgi:DNA-binding transcriptional MerR regulator